jgi:hypothetical protein
MGFWYSGAWAIKKVFAEHAGEVRPWAFPPIGGKHLLFVVKSIVKKALCVKEGMSAGWGICSSRT